MQLDLIRQERQKWFEWKDIKKANQLLQNIKNIHSSKSVIGDVIEINGVLSNKQKEVVLSVAKGLKPWRKGPFRVFDIFIDSEWQSFIKYNLIKNHLNITDKIVADVGCNNGYYMFRMLELNPKKIVGFDPSALNYLQFQFINHFIKSNKIEFELLGIEHLEFYEFKFDTIISLGVLYHRSDPISALKSIHKALNKNGEIIIDTLIIKGEDEICLFPKDRYAMMRNFYFLPTITTLKNWLLRAKFVDIELIAIKPTTKEEQRKTNWIDSNSLEDFLKKDDLTKTVEGYDAPIRAYVKARKNGY